jgi:hypothetical protein
MTNCVDDVVNKNLDIILSKMKKKIQLCFRHVSLQKKYIYWNKYLTITLKK